jgi:hypothetical protein
MSEHAIMTPEVVVAIEDDLKRDVTQDVDSAAGNFTHTRLRVGANDYEIVGFSIAGDDAGGDDIWSDAPTAEGYGGFTFGLHKHIKTGGNIDLVAVASSNAIADNASLSDVFIHQFTAPASPAVPLHIGGEEGVHPATVIHNVLKGDYGSTESLPRYSTSAIDTLLAESRPYVNFRITEPVNMAEFLEDRVQGPYGIIPTIDSSGVITHKSAWLAWLPNSTAGITYTFTGSNLRAPHPTWQNTSREMVTALRYNYTHMTRVFWRAMTGGAGDLIEETPAVEEREHDRMSQLGRRVLEVNADGLHEAWLAQGNHTGFKAKTAFDQMSREVFTRYG